MILLLTGMALLFGGRFLMKQWRHQRAQQLLALQLRQSLQNMVHALHVGASLLQAIERTLEDGEEPLAGAWRTLLQGVAMGTSLRQALTELGKRVPLKEMQWFVTAAQITQETGGSLAGVLDSLVRTLQERETLRQKVAALTAQGKASGLVLGTLPFVMMAALYLVSPAMIRPLFTTRAGQGILAAVIAMVSAGGFVILKIVSIEVA